MIAVVVEKRRWVGWRLFVVAGVVVWWVGEKEKEAGRDGLGSSTLELKQLLIIMERGEGVDRCFNCDKLNDDITNQVGTDRGRGPFTRDGYLGWTLGWELSPASCNKA